MFQPNRHSESPLVKGLRVLLRNPMALAGLAVILLWSLVAIFAPTLAPYDPLVQNIGARLQPPSMEHLCGTDELGRDVFSRILHGARISLPMGLIVVVFAMFLGGTVGALAGFIGGRFDDVMMRLADITLAFPSIVLALAIAAALGPSLKNLLIAMMAVWWPEYARLMRGQVLSVKNNDYVEACRAVGVPSTHILLRHIVPNAGTPLLVKASLDAGSAILTVAALSFIGLGAVPPTPEWGAMISMGRTKFYQWWMMTFPGLAILTVVLGFNFVGDGLRDALDPRLRGKQLL
ncbi:MAG: ABC transporter permease [Anaerolineae bacterium]|nr:ABC transporter permease [Anaerolineae bacterium]